MCCYIVPENLPQKLTGIAPVALVCLLCELIITGSRMKCLPIPKSQSIMWVMRALEMASLADHQQYLEIISAKSLCSGTLDSQLQVSAVESHPSFCSIELILVIPSNQDQQLR